jgi:hypothetical protein
MRKIVFGFISLLLLSAASFATTVQRLTLDDMIKKAHTIVQGRVRNASPHWSADGRLIVTTYTLDVKETIKGRALRSIDVTVVGGRIGNQGLFVSGMPSFDTGEEAVVFVENSGNYSTVVGLSQGKFAIRNNEVQNTVSSLSFPDGRDGVPLKMRLDDFKRQIKNRLQ